VVPPAPPFKKLGDYEVLAPISEGGMASVWLGRDTGDGHGLVALKVIRTDRGDNREFVAMFVDEARIASRLSHPNIIKVHGFGHDGRRHFLVMEVLRGHTLLETWETAHEQGRRLPHEMLAWIGARIADALHHAHELRGDDNALLQVIHRDVNPANIFLTSEGTPKLIDFGLAKALGRVASTAFGIIKGKLAYMAPEQTQARPIDRRADVFALGVTLWEMTLDRRLFKEDTDAATIRRVREAQVPDPTTIEPTYPKALAAILTKALARSPQDRMQSAAELRDRLDEFAGSSGRRIDASEVARILSELFDQTERPEWEQWLAAPAATPPRMPTPPAAPPAKAKPEFPPSKPSVPASPQPLGSLPPTGAPSAPAEPHSERVAVWDEGNQKLTWLQASVETILPGPAAGPLFAAGDGASGLPYASRLDAALAARIEALAPAEASSPPETQPTHEANRVALARAYIERAIVDETLADGSRAADWARTSLSVWPTPVAHGILRRLARQAGGGTQVGGAPARAGAADAEAASWVEHLDAEIEACTKGTARADLLAEKARALEAAAQPREVVLEAWERALAVEPSLPAALTGMAGTLASGFARPERRSRRPSGAGKAGASSKEEAARAAAMRALAAHFARLADTYAAEPRLSAWLQVERARCLEAAGDGDAVGSSLARALELDPGPGPVRATCLAHAIAQRDDGRLAGLLSEQAGIETNPARAAALDLDAACIVRYRLGEPEAAVALLERASAASRTAAPLVHLRALDELCAIHESAGRPAQALGVRRARLFFLGDPRARAHELRSIAALAESAGEIGAAIAALEEALSMAPADSTLVEGLDRLLASSGSTDRLVALWDRRAANAEPGPARARWLIRCAELCESAGDTQRAVDHLRTALISDPTSAEALDRLLVLLVSSPRQKSHAEAQARIEVHAHGAEHSPDPAQRIAHLEAMALAQEELLGDASLAAGTYEAILRLDPSRRGALAGLARMAARLSDGRRLALALLAQAGLATDRTSADDLRTQAAKALASVDPEQALALLAGVLEAQPRHTVALDLARRLHESAGRWALVDSILEAQIGSAQDASDRVDLLLARCDVQRTRLKDLPRALASARAALSIDGAHPAAREALMQLAQASGDQHAWLDALVELASAEPTPANRVRALMHAVEIAEHVLGNPARAAELSARAQTEAPNDAWIEERHLRVLRRLAHDGEPQALEDALAKGVDAAAESNDRDADGHAAAGRAPEGGRAFDAARAFELALSQIAQAGDIDRARSLVERVLVAEPGAPHALVTLERIERASGSAELLSLALARQGEGFAEGRARLGALWARVALLDRLSHDQELASTVARILAQVPDDRAALDRALGLAWPKARAGDTAARRQLAQLLTARLGQASDDTERLWAHLAIAIAHDSENVRGDGARAALAHYTEALQLDSRSVVAAIGTARLAEALGDAASSIAAAIARAELATSPVERATLLTQAAGQLLSGSDPRLGSRADRLERAAGVLERALEAHPEALPAVGLLTAVREEQGHRDKLLAALRGAFDRASTPNVVAALGRDLARVASRDPPDRLLAIEALRRVLAAAPGQAATLRALADQYLAQKAWGEAVSTLEELVAAVRDPRAKVAALCELGDLFSGVLQRPVDFERVLQAALDIDPASLPALRKLAEHRQRLAALSPDHEAALRRLVAVETDATTKAGALEQLAELRRSAGDLTAAEQALVEACALVPSPARLEALVALHSAAPAKVRALLAVEKRAQALGTRQDGAFNALLGKLEGSVLGRWHEAVAHLRAAVAAAPSAPEPRAALAEALVATGAHAEAVGLLVPMISAVPAPLPSLADPAGALTHLEQALSALGRADDATVVRELRAMAGGLDDGSHFELRARRPLPRSSGAGASVLGREVLCAELLPPDIPILLFDIAGALAGIERKIVPSRLDLLGVDARGRDRLPSAHALAALVQPVVALLGLARPDIALSETVARPSAVLGPDGPWLIVPKTLLAADAPVQMAALARPLLRIALTVAWTEGLTAAHIRAILCGAAAQVAPGYTCEDASPDERALLDDVARQVAHAMGRTQKKMLTAIAQKLASSRAPTLTDVAAFEQTIVRAELRLAFVATANLLATIDTERALDSELGHATQTVGIPALAALLANPRTGDLLRFALAPSTPALRARAGVKS
jgi:serine/threonine protein kinase